MSNHPPLEGYVFPIPQLSQVGGESGEKNYVVRDVADQSLKKGSRPDRGTMQGLLTQSDQLYSRNDNGSSPSASDQADAAALVAKKAERFVHAPLNQAGADERFMILVEAQRDGELGKLNAEVAGLLKQQGYTWAQGANAAIERVIELKLGATDKARCRMALTPFDAKSAASQFLAATSNRVGTDETMVYALLQRAVTEGKIFDLDREVGGMMGSLMADSDIGYMTYPSIGRLLNNETYFTRDKHARVHAILRGAQPHTPNAAASVGEVMSNASEWARDRMDDLAYDVSASPLGRESRLLRFLNGAAELTGNLVTFPTTLLGGALSVTEDVDTRTRLGQGANAVLSHPGAAYQLGLELAADHLSTAWRLDGSRLLGNGFGMLGGPLWLTSMLQKLSRTAALLTIDIGAPQPVVLRVEGSRLDQLGPQLTHLSNTSPILAPSASRGRIERVVQLVPFYEKVPPDGYAGTERVVEYISIELRKLGYEVVLVASGDSVMPGVRTLAPELVPQRLWNHPETYQKLYGRSLHFQSTDDIWSRALRGEFGAPGTFAILNHNDYPHMPFVLDDKHIVNATVVHGWPGHKDLLPYHEMFRSQPQVSISDAQRTFQPDANWVKTIHHGQPPELLTFGEGKGGYAAWLGRAAFEKGPDAGVRIARMANVDIRLAGKNSEAEQYRYYTDHVVPLLGNHATWIGEIRGTAAKQGFLGNASVCVCPYNWAEPFGIVFIEALATGTPVVAYGLGSVPEIIVPGLNGFFIDMAGKTAAEIEKEAAFFVRKAMDLPRAPIREDFVKRFSSERMTKDYLALFEQQSEKLQLRNPPRAQWQGWTPPSSQQYAP